MSLLDQGLVGSTGPKFNVGKNVKAFYMAVSILFTVAVLFFAYQTRMFQTSYSISQFIPENDEQLAIDRNLSSLFRSEERSTFYILVKNSQQWVSFGEIEKLKSIEALLLDNDSIKKISGIHNTQAAIDADAELRIGSPFTNLSEEKWKGFVQSSSFLVPNFINKDLDQVMLEVEIIPESFQDQADFDQLKTRLMNQFPGLSFSIAGGLPTQTELSTYLSSEIKLFFILIILMFVAISYLFFSDFKTIISIMGCLFLGNLTMVGLLSWYGVKFNALLSTVPVMVSISIVLILIHTLHLWALEGEHFRKSEFWQNQRNSFRVIRRIFLANLLGTVTMSLGFWTLSFNSLPIIKQYGWVISILMIISWFYATVWLFLVMPMLQTKLRPWTASRAYWMMQIFSRPKLVMSTALVIIPLCILLGGFLNFSSRLFDDLPATSGTRQANEILDNSFSGMIDVNFVITANSESDWKQDSNIRKLKMIDQQLHQSTDVRSTISLSHILYTDQRKPASMSSSVAETMFLYSMAEQNPVDGFLSRDGKSTRVTVRFKDLPSYQIRDQVATFKSQIQGYFPEYKVAATGLGSTVINRNIQISKELVYRFWHSMLIIAILLVFVFRSFRWVVVACVPNLVPPAILVGAMGLFQIPIKPSVAVIFSIALGLAFNNTVYVLLKLKRLYKQNNNYLPVKAAFLDEGNPCLFATLVVFAGFSVFLFSDFQVNIVFGALMLLSIFSGLLGDLVLLPVILKKYPYLLAKSHSENVSTIRALTTLIFTILALIPRQSTATPNGKALQILEKSQKLLQVRDESADVKMTIFEADGSQKIRNIRINSLKGKDSYYVMAKVESPADIKGTGFLGIIKGETESQWIYLPSSKQVRRIVGAASSAGLLGSEISATDLNSTAVKDASVSLMKESATEIRLEVIPKVGTSKYSKVIMTLDSKYLPTTLEYFEGSKNVKSVMFEEYKKYKNVYRPNKMLVKNLVNKRSTEIVASKVKINQGLKASEFNPDRLSD